MIVRASGPDAINLCTQLCGTLEDASASLAKRRTISLPSEIHFPAWVWRFISPRSYTGQDLIEWHIPGNMLLARLLLDRLVEFGARPAEPGEFTARAYFNGKFDLTQAEGVAASIAASNSQELNAARQLMAGELSRRLRPVMDLLLETIALVEVGIDFSEEDVEFLSSSQMTQRLSEIDGQLRSLVNESGRFEKLSHEPTIVLAGRPNAGKSTLTNSLTGRERSMVSPVPGTTRDVLTAQIVLRRGMARLIDVAGLDDSTSGDGATAAIEQQMQSHAQRAMREADVLVLVRDMSDRRSPPLLPREADLQVASKLDLFPPAVIGEGELAISAVTGLHMDRLRQELDRLAFGTESPAARLAMGARHLRAIEESQIALKRARELIGRSPELLAADLREVLDALGQILGQVTPDDILGKIFSTFCIGK